MPHPKLVDTVQGGTPRRVLVFNFFAGLKARGIPLYARELEVCFERVGAHHEELRAPAWLAAAPVWLQNLAFVYYEQVVAPWTARRLGCELTVYPYNSVGLWDAWRRRAVMVVHDLIPNRRDQRGLAARYIRTCQVLHARRGGPLATVSRHTQRQLQRIPQFALSPKYLWVNPFYGFERALALMPPAPAAAPVAGRRLRVVLCSGTGANKDFRGALTLLSRLGVSELPELRVLGFGDSAELARGRVTQRLRPAWAEQVTVLPQISLSAIIDEFRQADFVWVHSRAEGFGRPVMEARLCGRPVLATDIGAFRQLRKLRHVHLYRDEAFGDAWRAAVQDAQAPCPAAHADFLHHQIEAEVARLLTDTAAASPHAPQGHSAANGSRA